MGEVYRALDTRLKREVAIKVMSRASVDPDRLSRFEQEARACSRLNHPNILAVYDVGIEHAMPYLVCELLHGETLRARLEKLEGKPLPLRKALDIAIQVAQGLAAAHEKGIIHRDLKPDNLFVLSDGRVKILDFGLAKLTQADTMPDVDMTTSGRMIVGTVGYMSPEQVRGETVGPRSDIFSFGAVVYEMMSGTRAFSRDSAVETMTAIVKEDPPSLCDSDAHLPIAVDQLTRHCLEKNPDDRFQSAKDLTFALRVLLDGSDSRTRLAPPHGVVHDRKRTWRSSSWLIGAAGAVLGLLAGVPLAHVLTRGTPIVEPPALRNLTYSGRDSSPASSPDGQIIAFTSDRDGRHRLWLKRLSGGSEVALTEGNDEFPRFSPDGSTILFSRVEASRSSLYKVSSLGGPARRLVDDVTDGDWSPDGRRIVFTRWKTEGERTSSIIGTALSDGSEPRELATVPDQRLAHPRWSPDGRTIAAVETLVPAGLTHSIVLVDAANGTYRLLPSPPPGFSVSSVVWSTGNDAVIYMQAESVVSASGSAGVSARLIAQNISSGEARTLFWSPANSLVIDAVGPGRLVYDVRSPQENLREVLIGDSASADRSAHWITRGSSNDRQPIYSPDGEWVMFTSNRGGNLDLWRSSPKTGAVANITDSPAIDWDPSFAPDGKILWSSNRTGHFEVWTANVDGSAATRVTNDGVDAENPTATPDGRWVVYNSGNPAKGGVWKIRLDGSEATRLVAGTTFLPEVSPDGQHVLYLVGARTEVTSIRVVRLSDGRPVPFEIHAELRKRNIGTVGRARWMPDGKAIAFLGQDEQGVNGVYVQEFAPGRDTSRTRRPLGGFDADVATETFGLSLDGSRLVIAGWDQVFALMLADHVPL